MPQAVATWAVNYLGVTGYVATAVYAAAYVGTLAVIGYGASALMKQDTSVDNPGSLLDILVQSDAPRQLIIGERLTAGSMVGRYVTDADNNTLIEVIALADHECEGCLEYIANGTTVATNLVHGVKTPIPEYRGENDQLWVTWYNGNPDQTYNVDLASHTFPFQTPWTNAHHGKGISYAIVEMSWHEDKMVTPVQSQFLMRGAKLYDRRKDSTAGGSGTHTLKNPSTWEYSNNPDVFGDHYQFGIVPYLNSPILSWGIGMKPWQLPFDEFKAEADISDEDIQKNDGTYHKRYRLNAIFSGLNDHGTILKAIAKVKAGRVVDRGGKIVIKSPKVQTSVMTLYDNDLIDGEGRHYSDKKSISDLSNVFSGTFPDPEQRFRSVEYPELRDSTWISDDGGDELQETVDFNYDTDEERIQRLVWLHAQDVRRQARLTESYVPAAIEIQNGDWFERVSSKFPSGKMFEAIRVEYTLHEEKGFFVTIFSKEVDPDDLAWQASNASQLSRPPFIDQEPSLSGMPIPAFSVVASSISGGNQRIPSLTITWSNASDTRIKKAAIEIYQDGQTPKIIGVADSAVGSVGGTIVSEGIVQNTTYHVRLRYEGVISPSAWSPIQSVTTSNTLQIPWASIPDRPQSLPDIDAIVGGAITQSQQDIAAANITISQIQTSTGDLIDDVEARLDAVEPIAATNTSNISTLQSATSSNAIIASQLGVRMGDAESDITSIQSVNATQTNQINSHESSLNDPATGLNVRAASLETRSTNLENNKADVSALNTVSSAVGSNSSNISSLLNSTSSLAISNATLLTQITSNQSSIAGIAVSDNRVYFSEFEAGTTGWHIGWNPDGITSSPTVGNWNGLPFVAFTYTATTSGQRVYVNTNISSHPIRVTGGERICIQAGLESQGPISSTSIRIRYEDKNGNYVSESTVASKSGAVSFNTKISGFATVPSGAVKCRLVAYALTSGAGSGKVTITQPMISSAHAAQTKIPSFVAGPNASDGADVTENSAAYINLVNTQISDNLSRVSEFQELSAYQKTASNMVPNGDLSNGSEGWNLDGFVFRHEWNGPRLQYSGNGLPRAFSPIFKVQQNLTFTAGATRWTKNRPNYPTYIQFRFFPSSDGTGTPVYSSAVSVENADNRLVLTAVVPSGYFSAQVYFAAVGNDSGYTDLTNITCVIGNRDIPNAVPVGSLVVQNARVTALKEALSTGSTSRALIAFGVNTANNEASLELLAQEGNGVWNGNMIRLNSDLVQFGHKTTGARTTIASDLIEIYDTNNVRRIRLGVWS